MAKQSIYKNDQYILSFEGGDVVYLDLEITIDRECVDGVDKFTLNIVRCQINKEHMAFAAWLVEQLPVEGLRAVYAKIHELLQNELQPSLFSYYYNGIVE